MILMKSSNQQNFYRDGSLDERVQVFYWTDIIVPLHFGFDIEEDREKLGFVLAAMNEIENKTCLK